MTEKCNKELSDAFNSCLYFASNRFTRIITEMAEEEFMATGLSPSYAFAQLLINNNQGITPLELGKLLHLAPSTLTRFIDKLENKGLVNRSYEGKNSFIYSTKKGKQLQPTIEKVWFNLYIRYKNLLGEKFAQELTDSICKASSLMEETSHNE